jgi:hypothetical protein
MNRDHPSQPDLQISRDERFDSVKKIEVSNFPDFPSPNLSESNASSETKRLCRLRVPSNTGEFYIQWPLIFKSGILNSRDSAPMGLGGRKGGDVQRLGKR